MAGGVIRLSPVELEDGMADADSSHLESPSPRPWRDGEPAVTPTARSSSIATALPSGAGAPRGAPPDNAAGVPDPLPVTTAAEPPPCNLIRANVPERVAMLLTGHQSRDIFDRYNIIHEQELLDAGDQLVAYLAQQAQATPVRRWPHTAGPAAPRTASPLRLVLHGIA